MTVVQVGVSAPRAPLAGARRAAVQHAEEAGIDHLVVGDTGEEQARGGLAQKVQGLYELPFERFERYSPYGTPEDVAEGLAGYVEAGCRSFDLIPGGVPDDEATDAVAQVRRLLR